MKLAKYYLEQVAHADQLQTIAFVIFFLLFVAVMIWVITGPKKMYAENGMMPLENDDVMENFDNNNKIE